MTKAACLGLLVVHGIREWAGKRGGVRVGVGQGLQQTHISAHPSLLMNTVPHLRISLLVQNCRGKKLKKFNRSKNMP